MVSIRRDWYKTGISVGSHGNPDTVILQWSHFVDNTSVLVVYLSRISGYKYYVLSSDRSGTVLQSTGGSGTVRSTESCLRGNCEMQQIRKIHEKKFKEMYSGFANGIRIPTDKIQHPRLDEPSGKEETGRQSH